MEIGQNNSGTSDSFRKNSHLSIELGGGFSFILEADRTTKQLENIEIFATSNREKSDIWQLINSSQYNSNNHDSISISLCNTRFTLVPDALFDREHAKAFLQLNAALKGDEIIYNIPAHTLQAHLVFAAEPEIKLLQKKFPSAVISHCVLHFLHQVLGQTNSGNHLHLSFYPDFFLLAVTQNGKLLFLNAFPFRDENDVLYYSLFVNNQLGLTPDQIKVNISGEIGQQSGIARQLEKYFIHVGFSSAGKDISRSAKINAIENHRFLSLIDQFRCAL